jgi:CDP-glucose 4,6-dehydratase
MRAPSAAFWRGRRVLLTGHTGFKGAWAALWLERLGARVSAFALPPEAEPSLFTLARVADDVSSAFADLRDREAVAACVAEARPEIVLHMAAQPLVRRSIAQPLETIATNVLGTANLLDVLREVEGLSAVLVVTSDKVYANADQPRRFTESDRLGGKDPYSGSKAACEIVTNSFAQTYFERKGIAVATARGGNVIGGGDFAADRILPDAVRALEKDESIVLRHPEATRPWQHVLDCVAGYLVYAEALCSKAPDLPRALNIGPDESVGAITVGELVESFQRHVGTRIGWKHEPVPGSIEMKSLQIDARLARSTLGWDDRLPGMRAVEETAAWYRRYLAGADAKSITVDQISAYEGLQRAA